jgi:hypothetical protein
VLEFGIGFIGAWLVFWAIFCTMKRLFHKTIRQIKALLSLLVYVYALILLPMLHFHLDNTNCGDGMCNSITCDSCLPHSNSQHNIFANTDPKSDDIDSNHECSICKFLCTTVPLFSFDTATIIVTEILSALLLISVSQNTQLVYGVPSCRAPPILV